MKILSAFVVILLLELTTASTPDVVSAGPCPNGTSWCPSSGAADGGCCPYVDGTCCTDGQDMYCCPPKEVCIPLTGLCHPALNRPWKLPTPAMMQHSMLPVRSLAHDLHQPQSCDNTMSCSDGSSSTCCPSPYIGYDCCPLSNGVCCGDFLHCCPASTRCDLKKGGCVNDDKDIKDNKNLIPFYRKTKAVKKAAEVVKKLSATTLGNIKCLDNVTVCYDADTCCPVGGGSYGCCPIPNAVCCPDFKNCCPSGMRCDAGTGSCVRQNSELFRGLPLLSSFAKKPASSKDVQVDVVNRVAEKSTADMKFFYDRFDDGVVEPEDSVICPGGQYSCPDWMTCCASTYQSTSDPDPKITYGCCPFQDAVCCDDYKHCCPHATTCDLTRDVCIRNDGKIITKLARKLNSKKVDEASKTLMSNANQLCPDRSTCPDTYTCCKLSSGAYGCCPYSSAVCCDDHIHCCPQGTVCDSTARGCRPGNEVNVRPFGKIVKNGRRLTGSNKAD